jgi:hypothetical protein
MCFGELAFLNGLPRSAAFDDLRQHHPQTAIQLLLALAKTSAPNSVAPTCS